MDAADAVFFEAPADLRRWLEANHATADELWVGMYRRPTGRQPYPWPEVVDELLCFGWIDGVLNRIDEDRYAVRVTPRRRGSIWSAINARRVENLIAEGRITPAGRRAFEARDKDRVAYSYDTLPAPLDPAFEGRFRANEAAWSWFSGQAPSYRRTVTYWVMSAKRAETRERRLEMLIEDSAAGRKIRPLRADARS